MRDAPFVNENEEGMDTELVCSVSPCCIWSGSNHWLKVMVTGDVRRIERQNKTEGERQSQQILKGKGFMGLERR